MSKEIKKKSRKREYEIAKQTGGKRHTGSGSLWWKKSDASDSHFQYEDKFTEKEYFTISRAVLEKIEKEAQGEFKIPVLRFGFTEAKGVTEFVVLRVKDCVTREPFPRIDSVKKSHRAWLELLQEFNDEALGNILVLLSLDKKQYLLLTWDTFLDVKDIIATGGII